MTITTATYMSTQQYRNYDIVEAKMNLAASELVVSYVELDLDGEAYRYIIDGHHAHEAAQELGVEPIYQHVEWAQREADTMGHMEYLERNHGGDDPYDINTKASIW